ncbi:polyprenyl synthetase family protein [Brooklawnia sp.]|uniref:polyprenyl synthetase family protein n=1 Tax=Brooklawnia sp. TaxID=2699740 RepID=UPI00311DB475
MRLDPSQPTSQSFRDGVAAQLQAFLKVKGETLAEVCPALTDLTVVAGDFTSDGKRLRPAFAYWGYVATAGPDDVPAAIWPMISAFELLHAGILMHDDVLDAAQVRRGRPTVHRRFEAWHRRRDGSGDAAGFGRAMAVVLGDELLVWSDELAWAAGLEPEIWQRASRFWHLVRTEVNSGQVLDLWAQYQIATDDRAGAKEVAERVLEEKTSRYTVQRPVQFGAAAGGADDAVLDGLGRFGLALGRAFQLRDDLLGVFATQDQTGKPAAGDLVEGKRTVLLALALAGLSGADQKRLDDLVGHGLDDAQVAEAQELITSSGAVDQVEELIADDHGTALSALDECELTEPGRIALTELARQCVQRTF